MCVKSYQHFTKCDHVLATLTTCSTYRKQQDLAKGFFGCIFGQSDKKNCGKVTPQHTHNDDYCQTCSVRKDRLRTQGVSQGALGVHRQGFQELFHEEQKEAARGSLRKSEKHRRRGKEVKHDIIHVESSVFLNNLYHHPETLARKDAYAREAAPAPPASSHCQAESYPRERVEGSSRNAENGRERMPTYGSGQSLATSAQPAPTYQYSGRFRNHGLNLPPAIGLPPSQQVNRPTAPKLRHKTGHVYNSTKSRNQPSVAPYQDTAQIEAALRSRKEARVAVREPIPPKIQLGEGPSRWETKKALTDDDSDDSFACETSRVISNQMRNQPRSKHTRRSTRK
ncbi:hypothetical protein F4825DRAFT_146229 [Nemania diffusa]|nr:hypothetical protein F4825DRAFT_146229 [Nemania diffusa]